MLRFYLIRHGETSGNLEGRFRGRKDFPLNSRGMKQAEDLAEALKDVHFSAVYSSPLLRAKQTAQAIAENSVCSLEIAEPLNNISLGNWEGVLKSEIKEKYPNLYDLWLTNPEKLRIKGMETLAQVKKRSVEFIKFLVANYGTDDRNIAIVTHRAVLKPLIAGLLDIKSPYFWKIHIDTASYSIIEYEPQKEYLLYQLNQNMHLEDKIIEKE